MSGRDDDGPSKNGGQEKMIRPNNPELDVESLNARVKAVASRLRDLGVVEERRRERADENETSPRLAVARCKAADALLDRAESFNRPKTHLPKRLARLQRMASGPSRLFLRIFNYAFRSQRDLNEAQMEAMRELSQAVLILARRLTELEREIKK